MLFTRCILSDFSGKDGLRISVMSRHTLPDGITPDHRIQNFDIHIPILGPSARLIGDYYKRELEWGQFEMRYLEEIREGSKLSIVKSLAQTALFFPVTLLCIEETAVQCHRRLLAEECVRYKKGLKLEHR